MTITERTPPDEETIPPCPKGLSLAEAAFLPRAVLPLPRFDPAAAVALLAYPGERKAVAYYSHRKRQLKRLAERLE